jgi:hypothetical protein
VPIKYFDKNKLSIKTPCNEFKNDDFSDYNKFFFNKVNNKIVDKKYFENIRILYTFQKFIQRQFIFQTNFIQHNIESTKVGNTVKYDYLPYELEQTNVNKFCLKINLIKGFDMNTLDVLKDYDMAVYKYMTSINIKCMKNIALDNNQHVPVNIIKANFILNSVISSNHVVNYNISKKFPKVEKLTMPLNLKRLREILKNPNKDVRFVLKPTTTVYKIVDTLHYSNKLVVHLMEIKYNNQQIVTDLDSREVLYNERPLMSKEDFEITI